MQTNRSLHFFVLLFNRNFAVSTRLWLWWQNYTFPCLLFSPLCGMILRSSSFYPRVIIKKEGMCEFYNVTKKLVWNVFFEVSREVSRFWTREEKKLVLRRKCMDRIRVLNSHNLELWDVLSCRDFEFLTMLPSTCLSRCVLWCVTGRSRFSGY